VADEENTNYPCGCVSDMEELEKKRITSSAKRQACLSRIVGSDVTPNVPKRANERSSIFLVSRERCRVCYACRTAQRRVLGTVLRRYQSCRLPVPFLVATIVYL
jgi:hypothetical protein